MANRKEKCPCGCGETPSKCPRKLLEKVKKELWHRHRNWGRKRSDPVSWGYRTRILLQTKEELEERVRGLPPPSVSYAPAAPVPDITLQTAARDRLEDMRWKRKASSEPPQKCPCGCQAYGRCRAEINKEIRRLLDSKDYGGTPNKYWSMRKRKLTTPEMDAKQKEIQGAFSELMEILEKRKTNSYENDPRFEVEEDARLANRQRKIEERLASLRFQIELLLNPVTEGFREWLLKEGPYPVDIRSKPAREGY